MVLVVARRRLDRVDGGQRCSREELENKSRSQGAIQNGHSDSPKASSPYSFLWVWWQRKIMLQLMMMMMSENHAMPVTGPWDRDSGYWRTFAQNSIYIGQPWPPKGEGVVLTIHQSGKKGGGRIRTDNTILKVDMAGFPPHIQQQGLRKLYNYFVTGKTNTSRFSFPGDTLKSPK